jgi:hypothetical protein
MPEIPVPSPSIDLTPPPDPWTIDGMFVGAAIVAATVGWLYLVSAPAIYWMFPEFRATKTGPAAFPVTVHIGQKELSLTNGLSSPLRCELNLGGRAAFTTMMQVGAGQTSAVTYTKLGPYESEVRGAARNHIVLECFEPSGRHHLIMF